jgi:hypothetical protein
MAARDRSLLASAVMGLEFWYTTLLVGMLLAAGLFAVYVLYRLFRP